MLLCRYLRSEMDTPEFNQRFGILLEAYLRGCGETTFVSHLAGRRVFAESPLISLLSLLLPLASPQQGIQKQHTAVCNIMQVAERVRLTAFCRRCQADLLLLLLLLLLRSRGTGLRSPGALWRSLPGLS